MLCVMNWLLIASAVLGFATAIGHSFVGERFVLGPMYAERGENRVLSRREMRDIIRWVWHLPSFAWAQIAAATLWLALSPSAFGASSKALLVYIGVGVYLTAAFFNALALRSPQPGNILLTLAAAALWFGVYG